MKNFKCIGVILMMVFCVGMVVGCGHRAIEPSKEPTVVIAESQVESSQAPIESEEPMEGSLLEQIQPKDGYMSAKSLDGIDPLNDKVIALTFDDGPNPEKTKRLLDILEANDVTATFFVVGNLVEQYPDLVKRAYDQGHEIGTHSYTHPEHEEWAALDAAGRAEQYERANEAIKVATGLKALIDRPVGGAMEEEMAQEIGRAQIIWSVDPVDWKYKDADVIYQKVMESEHLQDGAVVLAHDIYGTTVDAFEKIIPELKKQGYRFVTVTQMMQIAEIRGEEVQYLFHKAPMIGAVESIEAF